MTRNSGRPLYKPRRDTAQDWEREDAIALVNRAMVLLDYAAPEVPDPPREAAMRETAVRLRLLVQRWQRRD